MPQPPPAEPGMREEEVDTPALLLDLDSFEHNLDRMAALLEPTGARLRAHAKTHKSPVVARMQMARGAVGQCVQKVAEAEALACVAGYCCINDVSEREYQLERGGQWDKGKGCDTFGPIGPWLVTADEVGDPQNLAMWLEVNGHRYQDGNTKTMIFGAAALVSYLSRFMTLRPGDVITTGTPPGVGMGVKPSPVFLKPGDVIRLGIEKLGQQEQTVHAWNAELIDS